MTYRYHGTQALAALADPTRREIFERIAAKASSVGDLARQMPVSRPAVSQHLRVLKDARLVTETRDGARHIYRIDPRGIGAMREWLDRHWGRALDAFQEFVDSNQERKK